MHESQSTLRGKSAAAFLDVFFLFFSNIASACSQSGVNMCVGIHARVCVCVCEGHLVGAVYRRTRVLNA